MKYLSLLKLTCLSLMICLLVSCSSNQTTSNDDGTGASSGGSSTPATTPSFNPTDGGQIIFGAVDQSGRALVLIEPTIFDLDFQGPEDFGDRAGITGGDVTDTDNIVPLIQIANPGDYYSVNTGYVQFYVSGLRDGMRVGIVVSRNTGTSIDYYVTISSNTSVAAETEYFRRNNIDYDDEFGDPEPLPCEVDPTIPDCQ